MREIKFRAWLTKKKAMAEVYTLGLTGIEYSTVSVNKELWSGVGNEDMVLMQFTGLKDKNGKDIYEGDIVTWSNKVYEIKWLKGSACYVMEETNGKIERPDIEFNSDVIGNIYEGVAKILNKYK